MRRGHYRFQFGHVIFPDIRVIRVLIAIHYFITLSGLFIFAQGRFHICLRSFVSGYYPVLSPCFDSHIAHGEPVIHRKRVYSVPRDLQ